MKFEDYRISEEIKKNLAALGFRRPTDIQYKSIPPILKGDDVLAIAQTGTGKTAAFVIPVVDLIHRFKKNSRSEAILCLVMVPTRELALQITEVFNVISKHTRVKALSVFGGVEQEPQIEKLVKGIDILVATPGRMFDLASQGYIHLEKIKYLILDEADHMLDLGFIKDIRQLIHQLPENRQTLFFSATIDQNIKELAYSLVKKPVRIEISPKDPVSKKIDHMVASIEMDDKRFFLERLIKENQGKKILVFVRTKVRAERVSSAMERLGIENLIMHGDKLQKDRQSVLDKFKTGQVKLLIATDVSARGIDIPEVDFVVNYDLPEDPEKYVHRIGRTGRGTRRGTAISFCSSSEKEVLHQIEEFVGKPIKSVEIDDQLYQETLDFSEEINSDWKALLKEDQLEKETTRKRKKKK